jgi:hypothetical protein
MLFEVDERSGKIIPETDGRMVIVDGKGLGFNAKP